MQKQMTTNVKKTSTRVANPVFGFLWSFAFLSVAILGVVALFTIGSDVFEFKGKSTGLVIAIPTASLLLSIVLFRYAIRLIGPRRAYIAVTTAEQRRIDTNNNYTRNSLPISICLGIILMLIWAALLVFVYEGIIPTSESVAILLTLFSFGALPWIGLLGLVANILSSRRART